MLAILGLLGAAFAGAVALDFTSNASEDESNSEPLEDNFESEGSWTPDLLNFDDTKELEDIRTVSDCNFDPIDTIPMIEVSDDIGEDALDQFLEGENEDQREPAPFVEDDEGNEGFDFAALIDGSEGQSISDVFDENLVAPLDLEGDAITGSSGDDLLDAGDAGWLVLGNEGQDIIQGGTGSDEIWGDLEDDEIWGGGSDDYLFGEDGDDIINGGDGDDFLVGGNGDDGIKGGQGDDRLFGSLGADSLFGGNGHDLLDGTYISDLSSDLIDEDSGDYLSGGEGSDILILGQSDVAHGGEGADTFIVGDYMDLSENDAAIPVIEDYTDEDDALEILFDATDNANPTIDTVESDDGLQILLDGTPIAQLAGVQSLDINNINLIAMT